MKIGLDVSAVPLRPAGAGRYVAELAGLLAQRQSPLRVSSRRGDEQRWRDLGIAEVRGVVPSARPLRVAYEALWAGHSSTVTGCDVWHGPHYTMPRRSSTPTVVTICDMTFFTNPEWHESTKVPFFRQAIRYAARHADGLVAISDFTRRQFLEIFPDAPLPHVAPLGVDLERFRPETEFERSRSEGVPYILCVGTLEPRKGLDVLIEGFTEVATEVDDVELWIVGQLGWGVEEFRQRLSSHPFASRIKTLGYVDDAELPELFRGAQVVAYPSRGEGFGLPVLEAMASGVPVVTTSGTVMADIAGGHAHLVPIGDASALAASCRSVLVEDLATRRAWTAAARTHAETYTWSACVDQHVVAYESAVLQGRRRIGH